jgi:hypothetical protein
LATSTTGLLARRAKSAKPRSFEVRPARDHHEHQGVGQRIAVSGLLRIRAVSEPLAPSSEAGGVDQRNSRSPSAPPL